MFVGVDLSPASSGVVHLSEDGTAFAWAHFETERSTVDLRERIRMAKMVLGQILEPLIAVPTLVGLEDYDLSPYQTVGYQIAEVSGILKYEMLRRSIPFCLIHPRKRQSFVLRAKVVTKNDVLAWAEGQGFKVPPKSPGKPGYYKRQREDLADAFVLGRMAIEAHSLMGLPPKRGDIFLDPERGLCRREDLYFGRVNDAAV